MTLGNRIKAARERLRPPVTQKQLADEFRITDKAVSGWERDEHAPDLRKLVNLAKILRVPLAWLLDGSGDPPPPEDIQVRLEALTPAERAMLSAMIDTLPHHRARAG